MERVIGRKLTVFTLGFLLSLLLLNYASTPVAVSFLLAVTTTGVLFVVRNKNREWRGALLILISGVLTAVLYFVIFSLAFLSPFQKMNRETHTLTGFVVENEPNERQSRTVLRVTAIDGKPNLLPAYATFYEWNEHRYDSDAVLSVSGKTYVDTESRDYWSRYDLSKRNYFSVTAYHVAEEGKRETPSFHLITQTARQKLCRVFDNFCSPITAPFAKAITLGEKEQMTDAQRRIFSNAGISHAFAVSGMHLGFLLTALFLLFRLFPIPKRIGYAVSILIVILFMALQGFSTSVTRAGVMACVLLFGKLLKRQTDTITSVSFAALLICVIHPFSVCDVSFQLSFLAVYGILICYPTFYQDLLALIPVKALSAGLAVSFSATLFTAPVSILAFGSVSYFAPITNLLCLPVVELVFLAGFLLLLFSFITPVATVFAGILEVCVSYLKLVTDFFGKSNLAKLSPNQTVLYIVLALVALIVVASKLIGKKKKSKKALRTLVTLVLVIGVLIGSLLYTKYESNTTIPDGELLFSAVSVGQGDCLVFIKDQKAVVIDCGTQKGDAAEALISYLSSMNITEVPAIIVSHMHSDHVSGVAEIAEYYDGETLYLPRDYELSYYADIASSAEKVVEVEDDCQLYLLDGVLFTLYTDYADDYDFTKDDNYNKCSTVVFVDYGESEFLLCGDITKASEKKLLSDGVPLDVDVLKVPHHGSNGSNCEEFLKEVSAEIAVISYGDNSYNLPSPDALQRIKAYTDIVYTTYSGTVQLITSGDGHYSILK